LFDLAGRDAGWKQWLLWGVEAQQDLAVTGTGLARPVYFTILTSHTILAAVIAPFVVVTLYRALKGRFDDHKRIARLVYPIWLYVSVTGVIVYLMLYQIYPVSTSTD
jgi:uncharacterized membrane protein YozB (DUF420 family)